MNALATPKTLSDVLTNSRLKCAQSCARLHHYRYDLGYRPVDDPEEAAFGTLIHLGLEVWWNAVRHGISCVDNWLLAAAEAVRGAKVDKYDEARAVAMLAGYHALWAPSADLYEVLGVEECFFTALVNPATHRASPNWRLGGKIDVRLRRKSDGALVIMDHKTSGENIAPGSFYYSRLRLDSQVSTYFDGAAVLTGGELPQLWIHDVLGKPGQRPLKATPIESRKYKKGTGELYAGQRDIDETPAEYFTRCSEAITAEPNRYFSRVEVVRFDSELDEARAEVWQRAAMIRENHNAGRAPKNDQACAAFGRPCSFFEVCTGAAALDDPRLFYRTEQVHPELAGLPSSDESAREVR